MEYEDRLPIKDARKLARQLRSLGNVDDQDFDYITRGVKSGSASIAPDASIEALVKALLDEELSIRAEAARSLGASGKRASIKPLLAALQDEQRFVRAEAARALGKLGHHVPLEPLASAMRDRDGSVRVAAVQALGMLAGRVPAELLISALRDTWPPVREAAVLALGKVGARTSIQQVVAALQDDEDKFVRIAALHVLGGWGERAPIEPVIAALGDKQKRVREVAIEALGNMGQRVPVELLETVFNTSKWPPMREGIIRVLEKLGQRVPEKLLLVALHDEWPPVREAAEQALQRRHEEQTVATNHAPQPEGATENDEPQPGKPFDFIMKPLRSLASWLVGLGTLTSTALAQLQLRRIGKDNKITLLFALICIGAWLLATRRQRASSATALKGTQQLPITFPADSPAIQPADL